MAIQSNRWKPVGIIYTFGQAISVSLTRWFVFKSSHFEKQTKLFRLIYPCLPAHGPWAIPLQLLSTTSCYIDLEFESWITFVVSNSSARSNMEIFFFLFSNCPSLEGNSSSLGKMIQRPGNYRTIFLSWREEEGIKELFMSPTFFKIEARIAPHELSWYYLTGSQETTV